MEVKFEGKPEEIKKEMESFLKDFKEEVVTCDCDVKLSKLINRREFPFTYLTMSSEETQSDVQHIVENTVLYKGHIYLVNVSTAGLEPKLGRVRFADNEGLLVTLHKTCECGEDNLAVKVKSVTVSEDKYNFRYIEDIEFY